MIMRESKMNNFLHVKTVNPSDYRKTVLVEGFQQNEPPTVRCLKDTTISTFLSHLHSELPPVNRRTPMTRSPRKAATPTQILVQSPLVTSPASPTTNEKGEITSWSSTNKDGQLLKQLWEGGAIRGMMAAKTKSEFSEHFGKYATRTLQSVVSNLKKG